MRVRDRQTDRQTDSEGVVGGLGSLETVREGQTDRQTDRQIVRGRGEQRKFRERVT